METTVINLISGPGSGKTTMAALLFAELKIHGELVEYVPEYAKKLVWLKDFDTLNNQYIVTRNQVNLLSKICSNVRYIVTDGCILNGLYYNRHNPNNVSNVEKTEKMIIESFYQFHNINIFIERGDFEYETAGRIESEEEAHEIDRELKKIMTDYQIPYRVFTSDKKNINAIMEFIKAVEIEKTFQTML